MKRYLISFVFLVLLGGYAILQFLGTRSTVAYTAANSILQPTVDANVVAAQSAPPPNPNPVETSAPAVAASAQSPAAPASQSQGQYADGTYTGRTEDAFYGPVQVQVAISGGQISAVKFLQYPNDRSTSRFINQQAMPILEHEAIQTQNSHVDGVSGASDTSAAFRESLASALSQAS